MANPSKLAQGFPLNFFPTHQIWSKYSTNIGAWQVCLGFIFIQTIVVYTVAQKKTVPYTINTTQFRQLAMFTDYFWYRETLFNAKLNMIKSFYISLEPAAWFPRQ